MTETLTDYAEPLILARQALTAAEQAILRREHDEAIRLLGLAANRAMDASWAVQAMRTAAQWGEPMRNGGSYRGESEGQR